jgi:hypothetical protein
VEALVQTGKFIRVTMCRGESPDEFVVALQQLVVTRVEYLVDFFSWA